MKEKIKYQTVSQYHDAASEQFREKLDQLWHIIKKAAPEAEACISYNMPAFKMKEVLVYYAANKAHIGFYPTGAPIVFFEKELKNYKTSKGAIQFPIEQELPEKLIVKIVQYRVQAVLTKKRDVLKKHTNKKAL